MERLDFIRKLFILYGKSTEKNIDLIRDYDCALSEYRDIDWDKMMQIVENTDKDSLPTPKWLRSNVTRCIKETPGLYKFNDGNGVLRLKDRFYIIPMYHCTHTLEELRRYYKSLYKNNFVSFVYYPADFTIIDHRIYDKNMQLYEVIKCESRSKS